MTKLLKGLGFVYKKTNLFLEKIMRINKPNSSTTLYLRGSVRRVNGVVSFDDQSIVSPEDEIINAEPTRA